MRCRALLMALALMTAACSKPAAEPPAPPNPPAPVAPPPAAEPKHQGGAGWRHLASGGSELALLRVEPDGSGLILRMGGKAVRITVGEQVTVGELPVRSASFQAGSDTVTRSLIEAPPTLWEDYQFAISPDGRQIAFEWKNAIWVAPSTGGTAVRVTSEPGPTPPNMRKHQPWMWASHARWSADGKWIYFTSNRSLADEVGLWRVPAAGGKEERISDPGAQEHLLAAGRPMQGRGLDGKPTWAVPSGATRAVSVNQASYVYQWSPDGRWEPVHQGGALRIRSVGTGKVSDWPLPPGANAEMGTEKWAPDGDRFAFHMRVNRYEIEGMLGVANLKTGAIDYYAFPEPGAGHMRPLGWLDQNRVIVWLQPWDEQHRFPDMRQEAQIWLLDLNAYTPPPVGQPTKLLSASLGGPVRWHQHAAKGPVTGGDAVVAEQGILSLRFDRAVSPDWLRAHVKVTGAALQTHGAPLGIAAIPIPEGEAGAEYLVEVASLNFRLRVRREAPPTVQMFLRQPGGQWQLATDDRFWPKGPLEIKLSFSKPMNQQEAAAAATRILFSNPGQEQTTTEWQGNDLLIRTQNPPPFLRIILHNVHDAHGLELKQKAPPPIRVGEPDRLVAAGAQEVRLRQVPPDITSAQLSDDGRTLLFSRWVSGMGEYDQLMNVEMDLASGEVRARAPEKLVSHSTRSVVLETRRLSASDNYWYASSLLIKDGEGQVLRQLHSIPSFSTPIYTAWSADGEQLAFLTSTGPGRFKLQVLEMQTGQVRTLDETFFRTELSWSPDGRYLAVGESVLEAATLKVARMLNGHVGLRWSRTGDKVLYLVLHSPEVEEMEIATGAARRLGRGVPVGWDRDGRPLLIRQETLPQPYVAMGI